MVHRIGLTAVIAVAVMASVVAEAAPPAPKTTTDHDTPGARSRDVKAATIGVDHKVNINTASVKELMTLDGVGHKLAEKIVEYRDSHGRFKKTTDIRKVEGFGGGLWEKNRERVVIE